MARDSWKISLWTEKSFWMHLLEDPFGLSLKCVLSRLSWCKRSNRVCGHCAAFSPAPCPVLWKGCAGEQGWSVQKWLALPHYAVQRENLYWLLKMVYWSLTGFSLPCFPEVWSHREEKSRSSVSQLPQGWPCSSHHSNWKSCHREALDGTQHRGSAFCLMWEALHSFCQILPNSLLT